MKRKRGRVRHDTCYRCRTNWNARLEKKMTILAEQDCKCAICKKPIGMSDVLDHSHRSGKDRGMLCNSCNVGIGMLKDNINIIGAALRYLIRYKEVEKELA